MRKMAFVLCLLVLSGCGDDQKVTMYEQTNAEEKQEKIKKQLEDAKEIERANIVILYDEVFIAMQVKPWRKFNKQKIEKKWQDKLEKEFPNDKVHVSTDFKLHWESTKLMEQESQQQVIDKIEELKKLAKEET